MAMALDAVWQRVKNVCRQNGLLIMSVLAVVIGCLLGFFLRTRRLSEQVSATDPLPLPPPPPCQAAVMSLRAVGGRQGGGVLEQSWHTSSARRPKTPV